MLLEISIETDVKLKFLNFKNLMLLCLYVLNNSVHVITFNNLNYDLFNWIEFSSYRPTF